MNNNVAYEEANLGVQLRPQAHPPMGTAQPQQEDDVSEMYVNG